MPTRTPVEGRSDNSEPIRVDEARLFEAKRPVSLSQAERINMNLRRPIAYGRFTAFEDEIKDPAFDAQVYATGTESFAGKRSTEYLDTLLLGSIELMASARQDDFIAPDVIPVTVSLDALIHLLRLKERAALSMREGYAGSYEKAMEADEDGRALGLRKKLVRPRGGEAGSLATWMAGLPEHGDKPVSALPVTSRADEFVDKLSRLRVGTEIVTQETHRLYAAQVAEEVVENLLHMNGGDRRAKADSAATLNKIIKEIDPRDDSLHSHDSQPIDYITRADRRLAAQARLHYTLQPDAGLSDTINEELMTAQQEYADDIARRFSISTSQTFSGTPIEYVPSNVAMPPAELPRRRAAITLPEAAPRTIPTAEEQERFKRTQAERREVKRLERLTRRKDRQEQGTASDVAATPELIESLNRLVEEQADILAPYRSQSSKRLRSQGIIGGNNSLDYALRQSKLHHEDGFDNPVRLYDGLCTLVATDSQAADTFAAALSSLDTISTSYDASASKAQPSRIRPLQPGLRDDARWLDDNWVAFTTAARASANREVTSVDGYYAIKAVLETALEDPDKRAAAESARNELDRFYDGGVNSEAEVTEDVTAVTLDTGEIATINRDERNELDVPLDAIIRANELAEQLDWVVLPDTVLTPDELVRIAKTSLETDGKSMAVDRGRMVRLLAFRDEYGGILYRSSERMLGDSNNLYFVLTFVHPGDDNTYAIAENVVHGNATYVLRQDTMPLNPGESVLTAVKLSRKDIRELGAKRVIHTANGRDHSEKLIDAINDLSQLKSV